ncbi:YbaN family protein [Denitromonas sp.]|uniref:YbaN family protein n=1 Tax=Denitromonas sp. TaxID=2734609 RepID=UPI003A84C955
MRKPFYLTTGVLSLVLGLAGVFLPLLPTTPFVLLAAFCFARGNPAWEARLLADPRFGPSIRAWRERGAISVYGKRLAVLMMLISALGGWYLLTPPWHWVPAAFCAVVGAWVMTRPSA